METQDKTAAQLVQDLIAIHITRKDASSRLYSIVQTKDEALMAEAMQAAEKQSSAFLPALLDELSSYGDGVAPDANQNSDYIVLWNSTLPNLDTLLPDDAASIFKQLEDRLQAVYNSLSDPSNELPPSFREIIETQRKELVATKQIF